MGESELVELICRNYGLEDKVVRQYREIPEREAIERFLSPEVKKRLEEKECDSSDEKKSHDGPIRQRRLASALNSLLHQFKEEFCKTPEGKLWYECNVISGPVYDEICARAYSDAQKYAENIRKGAARTLATLGRIPNRYKL